MGVDLCVTHYHMACGRMGTSYNFIDDGLWTSLVDELSNIIYYQTMDTILILNPRVAVTV